ncbi:MAG: hypothetical protein HZA19_00910 [Nitrospirae bacterium]|nr:hypothetical protein [Nitrospirota bacterium]
MNIKLIIFLAALILFPILFILVFQVIVRDQMLEYKATEKQGFHEVGFPTHSQHI